MTDYMIYSTSIEHYSGIAYIIRVHEGPNGKFGDDWKFGCPFKKVKPSFIRRMYLKIRRKPIDTIAFLCLTQLAPTIEQINAMKIGLKKAGYTKAVWERRKQGKVKLIWAKL